MKFKYNLITIGRWAFLGGILLAVLSGFSEIPNLALTLFILGLIVGLLNVTEKESTSFLIAVIALLLIGFSGLQLGGMTTVVISILNNFVAFVAAAGLIVALKQVIVVIRPPMA